MNIYEKLQTLRCELQCMNLKKSGKNKFAGYEYYELQDFIPQINKLMLKYKMTSVLKYAVDLAYLKLFDWEKPEEFICFTSPMAKADLKGCHEVQNLGATETYIRRYLYMTAFEIVEHDALDSSPAKEPKKAKEEVPVIDVEETEEMTNRAAEMVEAMKMCDNPKQMGVLVNEFRSEVNKFPKKLKEWLNDERVNILKILTEKEVENK